MKPESGTGHCKWTMMFGAMIPCFGACLVHNINSHLNLIFTIDCQSQSEKNFWWFLFSFKTVGVLWVLFGKRGWRFCTWWSIIQLSSARRTKAPFTYAVTSNHWHYSASGFQMRSWGMAKMFFKAMGGGVGIWIHLIRSQRTCLEITLFQTTQFLLTR